MFFFRTYHKKPSKVRKNAAAGMKKLSGFLPFESALSSYLFGIDEYPMKRIVRSTIF